ncbi:MAG: hypothetical protein K0R75_2792 [Paenibacillaceae bacterium]|jgi:hypothetical protein|nr:hypothetical protein [Paenibacillaceae bacterium]
MSFQMAKPEPHVIYKADSHITQNLRAVRDRLRDICRRHANQYVRIETMDGQTIVGRIVNCQDGLLHVAVPHQGGHRPYFGNPYYNETIMTLVLYELLVITLLYT